MLDERVQRLTQSLAKANEQKEALTKELQEKPSGESPAETKRKDLIIEHQRQEIEALKEAMQASKH